MDSERSPAQATLLPSSYRVAVHRILMRGPADVSGLIALLDAGQLDVRTIVAIIGKTEGNGGVNDFTRQLAHLVFVNALATRLGMPPDAVDARVAIIMSGGTEGVLSPHVTVFAKIAAPAAANLLSGNAKRLAIGIAATRDFLPEELGRRAQVAQTALAVNAAMAAAGISDAGDVHFVQIKCPLLTSARIKEARRRGCTTVTDESYESMGYSRGASALGVALALHEMPAECSDEAILADWSLQSAVASTSAGIELTRNVLIVLGNAAGIAGDCVIGHAVMRDAIDLVAAREAFLSVGIDPLHGASRGDERLVNVFAKAEASPDGMIRGARHIMLDDTDISATRHARAAVGGLLAGLSGSGALYVSGGAEHQGPPGGGPIAVIARCG